MAYVVTAALVIAYDDQGRQVYAYEGETLPHQITAGEGKRLADLGMVRDVTEVAGEQQPADDDDLSSLSVGELRKLAAARGLDVPRGAKRAEIEALLSAKPAGTTADPEGPLTDLTVDQLLAKAAARGIDVPEGVTDPADLVAILEQ